jgi:hypothetical protein
VQVRLFLPAVLLLAVTACGQGGKQVAPTPPPSPSPSPSCPPGELAPVGSWPPEIPPDLPRPAGARIEKVETAPNGVTIVRFSTRNSLREGVLHVVREFPKHGFTLGRGDAEVSEADAPFQRGDVRGLVRMLSRGACSTLWLIAVSRSGPDGVPVAPGYSPPATASPLPFG